MFLLFPKAIVECILIIYDVLDNTVWKQQQQYFKTK